MSWTGNSLFSFLFRTRVELHEWCCMNDAVQICSLPSRLFKDVLSHQPLQSAPKMPWALLTLGVTAICSYAGCEEQSISCRILKPMLCEILMAITPWGEIPLLDYCWRKDRDRIRKSLTCVLLSNIFCWPGWTEKMSFWAADEQAPWQLSDHLVPSLTYQLLT